MVACSIPVTPVSGIGGLHPAEGGRGDWLVWGIALLGVLCSGWWLVTQAHPWDLRNWRVSRTETKRKYKDFMAPGLWYGALLKLPFGSPWSSFSASGRKEQAPTTPVWAGLKAGMIAGFGLLFWVSFWLPGWFAGNEWT
ncbi:MAG: hypothetical protein R3F31_21695 [Verrucomicrobiales bacterium]